MFFDDLTVSWRVGATAYTLHFPFGGPPRFDERPLDPFEPAMEFRPQSTRRGKPWTADEEARLAAAHEGGATPAELAELFQRSKGAVNARLVRLGLLEEATAGLRYPVSPRKDAPADEA